MSRVFVIGELACTWLHGGLEAAYRGIKAIKEAGGDAAKFQWCSDPEAMAMRRGVARDKYTRLGWSGDVLPRLREECERVGIEFMCTVFIPQDIPTIAKYVSRFKVAASEGADAEFIRAHHGYGKRVIRSASDASVVKNASDGLSWIWRYGEWEELRTLWCVSEYPTPLERIGIADMRSLLCAGLSDHTTSVLTGAVAVGAGARILEHHFRLDDTPESDPDYPHSFEPARMKIYIDNVREAERML